MNNQKNYFHSQRSLSSSISSSRTSSIYGSHIYELTQFSTPQICDICDELIDSKRPLNGLNRNYNYILCKKNFFCFFCFRLFLIIEGIRALQCRDCASVCHERCRSIASCKPCRRIGVSGSSDSQFVVNSTRFETGSVTGKFFRSYDDLCFCFFLCFSHIIIIFKNKQKKNKTTNFPDITDVLLEKAGKILLYVFDLFRI